MAFGGNEPPPIQKEPQARYEPEIQKAVIDEEERRKRVQMNRQKSRLRLPALQETASGAGLSNKL